MLLDAYFVAGTNSQINSHMSIVPNINTNTKTVTTNYGLYIQRGAKLGSTAITNSYGLFF
jgi:hypothetical protein